MLSIGEEHIDAALEAMKHDSQNGMLGAPGSDHISITKEQFTGFDDIFREYGVPVSMDMPFEKFKKLLMP